MNIVSILLFFTYCYGLGYSLTRFSKTNTCENHVFRLALGLGSIPCLGIFLNFIHIPLDWRIFLGLSLILPTWDIIQFLFHSQKLNHLFRSPSKTTIIVLSLFLLNTSILVYGSFIYPWLEDDDPWSHAAGVKYVAIEKNLNVGQGILQYINPYPPGYDLLLGVLHQTSPSMYWTLKFFNALIVGLALLFFFYFVKELFGSLRIALWSTFFLFNIPCFLTHFIWAHSLCVALFFPAFYSLLKTQKNSKYIFPSALLISGIFLTQPSQSIKFAILLFFFISIVSVIRKRIQVKLILATCIAIGLSLMWWGPVIHNHLSGNSRIAIRDQNKIVGENQLKNIDQVKKSFFSPTGGSATRAYYPKDYLLLAKINLINNPVGFGILMGVLAFTGLFLIFHYASFSNTKQRDRIALYFTLLWLIFTFLGINSATFSLPIGLFAFRFWMLLAIPICILSALTTDYLHTNTFISKTPHILFPYAMIFLTFINAGFHKISYNTQRWPFGVCWQSPEELGDYISLRENLPANTKVFTFSDNIRVLGHDMHADFWTHSYQTDFKNSFHLSVKDLYQKLKNHHYQYLIIGGTDRYNFGANATLEKTKALNHSNHFQSISFQKQGKDILIFKILSNQ